MRSEYCEQFESDANNVENVEILSRILSRSRYH